jgi:hypothetical protein
MKTLANPRDRDEIVARLASIGPGSRRRWGKMTAGEMVCHLSDALRVGMGERKASPISNWAKRSLVKWAALWLPSKWPHGVQTVPECAAEIGGTPPSKIEFDLIELRELLDRFATRPRIYDLQEHPIFGPLTEKEWLRWGYLHMDHHLRQFGA